MTKLVPENLTFSEVGHLPIVKDFAKKIKLVETINAMDVFEVDRRRLHFDTTSIGVFGDYDFIDPPLKITYGHSKDKRPDLKQFIISMLCVDRNWHHRRR